MTDDADDQADALTRALRARVEILSAWSIEEAAQSFETLSIALRCPRKPDSNCLERIGDQIHADHYIWGTMARSHGEVTAEVHLWNRDAPGSSATATFPDNIKDPESPRLRAVAVRLLESLLSSVPESPPVEHEKSPPPQAAPAPTPTPAPEPPPPAAAAPPPPPPAPAPAHESNHLTPVLGYVGLVAGAGLLIAGGIEGLKWASDRSTTNQDRAMVSASVTDVCSASGYPAAAVACQASTREMNDAVFAWVLTAAGVALAGTGIGLLLASGGSSETRSASAPPHIEPVGAIGAHQGYLGLRLSF